MALDNAGIEVRADVGVGTRSRQRDLVELVLGYGLILAVIWTGRPLQRVLYVVAVVYLGAAIWRGFESWRAMGFREGNLLKSLWIVGVAAGLAAGFAALGIRYGWAQRGHDVRWFVAGYAGYAVWALVQQVLLQDFFLGRVLRLMRGRRAAAVCAASGVFAVAHLPNPILTPLTLVWGAAACAVFLRYRNIWPLALAHALLGITLATTMPRPVIRNMRVGLGYLEYPKRHPMGTGQANQRSQRDHTVSTQVWVNAEAATRRF